MKTFLEMQEARRNPEQNPRTPAFEQLKKYNDKNHFFSFTSLKRIGIRPTSPHETPNGIYCFPATIMDDLRGDMSNVPYVGDMPYIHVLKKKGKGIVDPLESYSLSDLKKDIKKIWDILNTAKSLPLNSSGIRHVEIIMEQSKKDAMNKTPFGIFWNITRNISSDFGNFLGWGGVKSSLAKEWYTEEDKWEDEEDEEETTNLQVNKKKKGSHRKRKKRNDRKGKRYTRRGVSANAQGWNNLFRKLGYGGFVDRSGSGIIHRNEPTQAVFMSVKSFDLVEMIENKSYENLYKEDKTVKYKEKLEKRHNTVKITGFMPPDDLITLRLLSESDIRACNITYYDRLFEISGGGEISNISVSNRNNIRIKDVTVDGGIYAFMKFEKCMITGGMFNKCSFPFSEIYEGAFTTCDFDGVDIITNSKLLYCDIDKCALFKCDIQNGTYTDCAFGNGSDVKDCTIRGVIARMVIDSNSFYHRVTINNANINEGTFYKCLIKESTIKGGIFDGGIISFSIIKDGEFIDVKRRLCDEEGGKFVENNK